MPKNNSGLSQNKQNYHAEYGNHHLSAAEIYAVAQHYEQSRGISIRVQTYFSGSVNQNDINSQDPTKVALHNMRTIQSQLKQDEYAGYLHTNDTTGSEKSHIECFIVTKDQIIKPITWYLERAQVNLESIPNTASTDLAQFCGEYLLPQSDLESCASLSLAYLKQLLSTKGRSLEELTLSIPFFDRNQELQYFFVPSPQVLRYSQSESYNECMKAIVIEDKPGSFTNKEKCVSFTTLKYKLEETITIAKDKQNQTLLKEAESLLTKLPEFRARWIEAFAEMNRKRVHMQTSRGNQTLAYTSKRFHKIAIFSQKNENAVDVQRLKSLNTDSFWMSENDFELELFNTFNKLTCKNPIQLGYFLDELCEFLNPELIFSILFKCPHLLTLLQTPQNYMACAFLVKSKHRQHFHQHMHSFLQEQDDLKNNKYTPSTILTWAHALNIPEHLISKFVEDNLPLTCVLSPQRMNSESYDVINFPVYLRCLPSDKRSEILLNALNNPASPLMQKLTSPKMHPRWLMELLSEFCDKSEIKDYLKNHRILLLSMLHRKHFYPTQSETLTKLTEAIIETEFFFPDTPEVLKLHLETIQQDSSDKRKAHLKKMAALLPIERQQDFLKKMSPETLETTELSSCNCQFWVTSVTPKPAPTIQRRSSTPK